MTASQAQARFRIADLTLDCGQRRLWRGKTEIALTSRLFSLLRVLAESAPNVATHDELADRVWGPRRIVTPENLAQHVTLLRRALGDDAAAPRYIEAVRGEGYRLLPKPQNDATPGERVTRWLPMAAAVAAIAGVAFLAGRFAPEAVVDSPSIGSANPDVLASSAAPRISDKSIVVLPFASHSSDPEDEYFADGLTDELINRLSGIEGVRVLGRTSSFSLKGVTADPREIGVSAGVTYLLEGNVRFAGDGIRVGAQLVSTSNGSQIWSEAYDWQRGDMLEIHRVISDAVAHALDATIGTGRFGPEEFFGLPGTNDPEAYDRYLRALGLLQAGGTENLLRAEELLRSAARIDPEFLAARGVLTKTIDILRFTMPGRADALLDEWNELMALIVRTVPDHPAIQIGIGLQLMNSSDWIRAEEAVRAGVAAAPPGMTKQEGEAILDLIVRATGRFSESLAHQREVARRDPLSLGVSTGLQGTLHAVGRLEEAEREYVRSRDLQGNRLDVEAAALLRAVVEGFERSVIDERLARLAAAMGGSPMSASLVDALDDPDAALAILRLAMEPPASEVVPPLLIAEWADHFGDTDLALENVRRHLELTRRASGAIWTPFLRNTRATLGFKDLVADFRLLEYWRETGNWGDFCRPVGASDFECV